MIKKTHTTIRDNESQRACEEIHFSISPSEKRIFSFCAYGHQLEIAWVSDSGFFLLPISVLGPHQTPGLSDLCMPPVSVSSYVNWSCHFQKALPELVDKIKEAVFSRQNRAVLHMNSQDSDNMHKNDPILVEAI